MSFKTVLEECSPKEVAWVYKSFLDECLPKHLKDAGKGVDSPEIILTRIAKVQKELDSLNDTPLAARQSSINFFRFTTAQGPYCHCNSGEKENRFKVLCFHILVLWMIEILKVNGYLFFCYFGTAGIVIAQKFKDLFCLLI